MNRTKTKRETIRHQQAFEFWYNDPVRSTKAVATEFKVSVCAVDKWRFSFDWNRRANERDERIKKRLQSSGDQEVFKTQERQLKIARAMQIRFAERLANEEQRKESGATKYEPKGSDAIRAMQHERLILGQTTSHHSVSMTQGSIDALVAAIAATLRRVIPSTCPHCKSNLDLNTRVVSELQELSRRFQVQSKEVEQD